MNPPWLDWARRLQAIAQTGLAFTKDDYDRERYREVQRVAAELLAAGAAGVPIETIADVFSSQSGYATPKVDVRAAVFRDEGILLVKEREDGGWTLPGGWADVGDPPSVAAVREVKEESGYDVVARKLAMVYDRDRHGHPPHPFHIYKLFFLCDLIGGETATSHEIAEVGFFGEDRLPPLSLTRITSAEIALLFEHRRHPEWPASFD
jgi:ADP-ribose pyrophosphatase YjhB (NUDIX family)